MASAERYRGYQQTIDNFGDAHIQPIVPNRINLKHCYILQEGYDSHMTCKEVDNALLCFGA